MPSCRFRSVLICCGTGGGYQLANEGRTTRDIQDYLGHKNLNNVAIYEALPPIG
jgi:hypothetical protein